MNAWDVPLNYQENAQVDTQKRRDQFAGTLIGCAVGDALGAPLEGKSREDIAQIDSLADTFRPYLTHPVGQYTDDTQQTLAIVKSIVAAGDVDGATIASEFVKLWESGSVIGAGPVAKQAVERLIDGIPWQDAGSPEGLPLNGAAMRVSPIGLWHFDRPERLEKDAEVSSIVTHRHPLAIEGAIAIATAVAYAINHTELKTTDFLRTVSQSVAQRNVEFADRIQQIDDWLKLTETEALEGIVSASGQPPAKRGFGISAFVVPTVLVSLYAFLRSSKDYVATVERAIQAGGDVDTTAAISGAISGAHNGIDAIPGRLSQGVRDADVIRALGEQLFEAKCSDMGNPIDPTKAQ